MPNYDDTSGFWRVAGFGALGTGAAWTLKRAHPDIIKALSAGRGNAPAGVAAELKTLGRFESGRITQQAINYPADQLSKFAQQTSTDIVRKDIAAAAYESILAGGAVDRAKAYAAFGNIMKSQGGIQGAYQQATMEIGNLMGSAQVMERRLGQLGEGGFYKNALRQGEQARHVITSAGGYERLALSRIQGAAIPEAARDLSMMASKVGSTLEWQGVYGVKDIFQGKEILTPMLRGRVEGIALNIPLEETGLTYGGKYLATRYATRQAYGETGALQSYTERYMNELGTAMGRQTTATGLKQAVLDTNNQLVQGLWERDAAARAQGVWTQPWEVMGAGGRAQARMAGLQAVYAGPGEFKPGMMSGVIKETFAGGRQLFPFGSPETVAKGTMMTADVSQGLFGPLGQLMTVEQRPTQFIREWSSTLAAKQAAAPFKGAFGEAFGRLDRKIQGPQYKKLLYGGETIKAAAAEAYTAPQLMTFYAKHGEYGGFASEKLSRIMAAEEGLIAQGATKMMQSERVTHKFIDLSENFLVNEQVRDAARILQSEGAIGTPRALATPVQAGGFVGIEYSTGRELVAEAQRANGVAQAFAVELAGPNRAKVYMREAYDLKQGEYFKLFSEDIKALATGKTPAQMTAALEAAGAGELAGGVGGQAIEAMYLGERVSKNKMAMITQQMEAMGVFAGAKLERLKAGGAGVVQDLEMRRFMADPAAALGVNRILTQGTADAEFQIQKNMVSLAKTFGFKDREMALTFGLMDTGIAERLGIGPVVQAAPGVVGLAKGRVGHLPFQLGAGGLSSLDPAGFRLLAMKGEEGQRFAAELATRLRGKEGLAATELMMASALGEQGVADWAKQRMGKIPTDPKTLGQLSAEALIQEEGRYVGLGVKAEALGKTPRIYIPGTAEAPFMQPVLGAEGDLIRSPLGRRLEALRSAVARGGTEEVEAAAKLYRGEAARIWAETGQAGGKILGTRYLGAMRATAAEGEVARIPAKMADEMFEDLLKRTANADTKAFLQQQKKALLDEGQELIGAIWRHPTTGPESLQFMRYKVDRELSQDMMMVPRRMGKLWAATAQGKPIDISQAVGMKLDFDMDFTNFSIVSNKETTARLARNMQGKVQEGYTSYLFNHYAMKELMEGTKGPVEDVLAKTRAEALELGAAKLTTAKVSTGQVNIALQQLKLGLQHTAPDKYRPLSELFFIMEEAAISAKRADIGVAGTKLYQDIGQAVKTKDVAGMESVIKGLMGEKDRIISGKITGPTGELVKKSLAYNPREWAETAIEAARVAGPEVEQAYRTAQLAGGKAGGPREISELTELFFARKMGSIDVAQSTLRAQEYGGEKLVQRTNRLMRTAQTKSGAILGALKKAKMPLLAGAAVAGSLMLMAPSVSGRLPQIEGAGAGRNLDPGYLGPPSGPGMNPPPPRIMSSPKVYDMSGIQMASRANIRMNTSDLDRSSGDFMRQARELASGSNMRIRTIDDRSVLTPQRLANKIHEKL